MFNSAYKDKKVLVTGVTGFKGSWLALWLHKLGADVSGLADCVPTKPSLFEELQLSEKITYFKQDVRELEKIKEIISKISPDFIFHLAAQPIVSISYSDPIGTFSTNILGTANILEALRLNNKACNAIMITSDKCYENVEWHWGYRENDRLAGKDPYSASKSAAELVINSYNISFFKKPTSNVKVISTRAGNVIGGGDWAADRVVPDCVRAWAENTPVEIRNPNTTRPWQHVLEPLSGYLRCGQELVTNANLNGESYNFGPPAEQNYTVLELLNELSLHWHFKNDAGKYNINKEVKYHEAGLLKLNCDKALHDLKWKPILQVEEAASFTASWYDRFYNENNFNPWDFSSQQIDQYIKYAKGKNLLWAK